MKKDFVFRLEGEEDLDVLNPNRDLLYAIQLKNLEKTITLSDILSNEKTSFIKRFLENYSDAVPVLVSYGEISKELKNWKDSDKNISEKEKAILKKYKINSNDWTHVKEKIQFKEVKEEVIAEEIEKMLKGEFPLIDPIATIGFLLNWLQIIAENQQPITIKDFYSKIEDFGKYLTERIAIHNQYGLVLKSLHKVSTDDVNPQLLEKEFYNATLTRYEHVLLGMDITRDKYLELVNEEFKEINAIIIKGASGQGKTALLYSYIHKHCNDWLSFELNIQQDPVSTQKSIQAIASISKKLGIPTVFVINVNPNTTDWLQIVKESVHFNHVKFLVAIRNEDWYRASAIGVEFEHKEIDLTLSKEEAEIIYSRLNARSGIKHFSDFEEAWIQLGDNAPLLEFVYSITQGDSLHNKLSQQVKQILTEGNSKQQIDFLRIVSLAHSIGASIDVSKLDSNVDYQFIIEKLENEYLIKKSVDKKYIQGLHIVRSKRLVEILFDEFTNHKKKYAYMCFSFLADEDLYLFILQLFYLEIFKPVELLSNLNKELIVTSWSQYSSIIKAYIWAGTREYVEANRKTIDECRAISGDAWPMCLNFIFGSNYDKNKLFDSYNVHEKQRKTIDGINDKLSSNKDIFNMAAKVISGISCPKEIPSSNFEWRSFGEALFWIKNITDGVFKITFISEIDFESAFKKLDSKSLSKLMLGMYTYSEELNNIRKKYINYFIDRIKSEFDIIHLSDDGDSISLHYIIDIIKYDEKRSSNDFVVYVLNIIRTALPDKKQFNSQGYGHRLQTLSIKVDATHKAIPIENLPLEEWINVNSSIINLYEYRYRPADWSEYCAELNQWEILIKEKINEFNRLFNQLFKEGKTHLPVIPIIENISFDSSEKIKAPKSITDYLGLYGGYKSTLKSDSDREQSNQKLHSKFEKFFRSYSDFKSGIENFIRQSAQTLSSKIKIKNDERHIHDENTERLSQTNLYQAVEKLEEFNQLYKSNLGNIDANHITRIEINTLLTTTTFWKDYLNNTKGEHSSKRIYKLRSDFENRIIKDCKLISKANNFTIKYINNGTTNQKPIFIIDSDIPFWSLVGMKEAYNIVQNAIDNPEYTSLKYLMLQLWFSDFYFIQTSKNRVINNQWNEMKLYTIKDISSEELPFINTIPKPIDNSILESLRLESWTKLYPEFNAIHNAIEAYGKLVFLVDHFYDLNSFQDIELSESDEEKLREYLNNIGLQIQESLQLVLDSIVMWFNMFPFDENTYLESEEEQEYIKAIKKVQENIFPQSKGEEEYYEYKINMEVVPEWAKRLKVCTEGWGIFILLLYGKYIKRTI